VLYRISQTDATLVPKLTTTLVLPWELIVQQSFQPPCLLRDSLMNSSLPIKTVSVLKPNIFAVAPFPMMLLKPSALCGSNPSALLVATMACAKGCSERSSGSTG
jgi:hypothetical protein